MGRTVSGDQGAARKDALRRVLTFYRGIGVQSIGEETAERIRRISEGGFRSKLPHLPTEAPSCPMPGDEKSRERLLHGVQAELGDCQRCTLAAGRNKIVFGTGNPCTELLFVGEGPGRDEDRQGLPFVGAAGDLLNRIIQAMGFTRPEVYIANVVKCRPPNNRNPLPDEVATCFPFLTRQIETIAPRAIVALGGVAAQTLLSSTEPVSRMRGRFHDFRGIPVMPTYHPAYLLRNAGAKKTVWLDMQQVMRLLGKEVPGNK